MKQFLEIGKIVNTHGINGEIKVQPWCDTPDILTQFDILYFQDQSPLRILSARVHKGCVIMRAEGIDSIEKATALRERILYMNREDIELPEDLVFIQDIIGLSVYDQRLERVMGTLKDVLTNPANDVYVIQDGDKQYLVPAVREFLKDVDLEKGLITICTIPGMYGDED
jgi:16S rRNA processing protein RimM